MKYLAVALSIAAASLASTTADAQLRQTAASLSSLPPLVQLDDERLAEGRSHPILRTLAAVGGSAAGFAIAQAATDDEPDEIIIPMAAAVGGGAIGTMLFSNANPFRIIAGSVVSALPGAALAMYLVGVAEEDDQDETIPLVAFSIPHGLLTSAFGQNR